MPIIDLKTDLKSLKYGRDRFDGGNSGQPYIQNDINDPKDVLGAKDDGFIRGGFSGAVKSSKVDTVRITKFLKDNPLFIAKQAGLQFSNPRLETKHALGKNLGPTRIYNLGINTLAQVPVNAFGVHFNRHGILPIQNENTKYESVVEYNNKHNNNRLLKLTKKFNLGNQNGNEISGYIIDQYLGGPGSVYGIGGTIIKRYSFTDNSTKILEAKLKSSYASGRTNFIDELKIKNTYDYEISNPLVLRKSNLSNNTWIDSFFGKPINILGFADNLRETLNDYNPTTSRALYNSLYGNAGRTNINGIFTPFKISGSKSVSGVSSYSSSIFRSPQSYGFGSLREILNDYNVITNLNSSKTGYDSKTTNNENDLAKDGPSKSYSPTGNFQNPLNIPNSVYNRDYKIVENKVNSLRTPNNLGIYAELTDRTKNGVRIPDSIYPPTYSNKLGDVIKLTTAWNEITREIRVGSGITDIINLTPLFSGVVGSIGDKSENQITKMGSANQNNPKIGGKINDFVKFRIQAIDTDHPDLEAIWMIFRAYISNISDDVSAEWSDVKYAGRGEKFYIYNGFTRKMSVSFKVAALSELEMEPMYQKLNYLMSNMMPDYKGNLMRGPLMRMTIGNWIDGQLCILNNLSYKIPDDAPWEIGLPTSRGNGKPQQMILPHVVEVTLSFTPIGSQTRNENRISRKTEGTSNIAQNWNAGPGSRWNKENEPEYIYMDEDMGDSTISPTPKVEPPIPTPTYELQKVNLGIANDTPYRMSQSGGYSPGQLKQRDEMEQRLQQIKITNKNAL